MHEAQLSHQLLCLKKSLAGGSGRCGCQQILWGLWPAQNQGDRSHKYRQPDTQQRMQDRMAEPRAEDRLLMSDAARGNAGSRQRGQSAAQPSSYPKNGQG